MSRSHHSLATSLQLQGKRDLQGRTLTEAERAAASPNDRGWREKATIALKALAMTWSPDYAYAIQDAVRLNPGWTWKDLYLAGDHLMYLNRDAIYDLGIDYLLDAHDLAPADSDPEAAYWACRALEACAELAQAIGTAQKDGFLDDIQFKTKTWKEIAELVAQTLAELAVKG